MQRYAIIDGTNVVNVIEYETQPSHPLPGLDPSYVVVQSDVAGPGYTYINGVFTAPQPYPSWTLVDNFWTPPKPMPTTGGVHVWNESSKSWVAL